MSAAHLDKAADNSAGQPAIPTASWKTEFLAAVILFPLATSLAVGIGASVNAPPWAGVVSTIIGGVLVSSLNRTALAVTTVSAGLQSAVLGLLVLGGRYEVFLVAVVVAGIVQIIGGVMRAGSLASFVPANVIHGLLAAFGLILVLKQIPHVFGHDTDPEGEMSFFQPDRENTFSEILALFSDAHPGAALVGVTSVVLLVWLTWRQSDTLKAGFWTAAVIPFGILMHFVCDCMGGQWSIEESHLVQVPLVSGWHSIFQEWSFPEWRAFFDGRIVFAGVGLGLLASLESLLSLRGIDKLDPWQRQSHFNSELIAQGVGNSLAGLCGGLPISTDVVLSAVAFQAGARTWRVPVIQGTMIAASILIAPRLVNFLPMASVAAVLLVAGIRLLRAPVYQTIWKYDKSQLIPGGATLIAILLTDLPMGTVVGLSISVCFLLYSNMTRPVRICEEQHLATRVLHLEFGEQVSFLNRAAIDRALRSVPRGGHLFLDAANTVYMDADIVTLVRTFCERTAPAHGVMVSLRGFKGVVGLDDRVQFVEYSTKHLQQETTPDEVLKILLEGNQRFRNGQRLTRDLGRLMSATATGQHPMAVVLSCIDSRTPSEIIFDLGLGDVFSIRVAGNVCSPKVLGSIEYGCAVAGARLVLVVGHTRCGAVTSSVRLACTNQSAHDVTGCDNLQAIVDDIQQSFDHTMCDHLQSLSDEEFALNVDTIAAQNVHYVVQQILKQSGTLRSLVAEGRIAVRGAMYNLATGEVSVLDPPMLN